MIIGLTGKKQSGKDTFAYVYKDFVCARKVAFADPIREIGKIFGYAENDMMVNKDNPTGILQMSWRKFAQFVGTDLFRNKLDKDIWIKILGSKIIEGEDIIVTDVRFNNEAKFIRKKGGIIIEILRGSSFDTHESESGIDSTLVNYQITNYGSLENYIQQIQDFILNKVNYDIHGK